MATLDFKRQSKVANIEEPIDSSIAPLISKWNKCGLKTQFSCSGLAEDHDMKVLEHPGFYPGQHPVDVAGMPTHPYVCFKGVNYELAKAIRNAGWEESIELEGDKKAFDADGMVIETLPADDFWRNTTTCANLGLVESDIDDAQRKKAWQRLDNEVSKECKK